MRVACSFASPTLRGGDRLSDRKNAYEESKAMLTTLQTFIKIFQLAWPEKIGFKIIFFDSMQ
jgi:hypothetical protein